MKRLPPFKLEIVSVLNDYKGEVSHIFVRSWQNYGTGLLTTLPKFLENRNCLSVSCSWHHLAPASNCLQISFICPIKDNGEILWQLYQELSPTS